MTPFEYLQDCLEQLKDNFTEQGLSAPARTWAQVGAEIVADCEGLVGSLSNNRVLLLNQCERAEEVTYIFAYIFNCAVVFHEDTGMTIPARAQEVGEKAAKAEQAFRQLYESIRARGYGSEPQYNTAYMIQGGLGFVTAQITAVVP